MLKPRSQSHHRFLLLLLLCSTLVNTPVVQPTYAADISQTDDAPVATETSIEATPDAQAQPLEDALFILQKQQDKPADTELTLEAVLNMVQENNPGLQAEAATTQLARAKYLTSLAKLLPTIEASYDDSGFNGGFPVFGRVVNLDYALKQPQIGITIPLFQGGRKWLQAKATKKLVKAQEAAEQAKRQVTLDEAATLYFDMLRALNSVSANEQRVSEATSVLDLNKERVDVGVGTELDVLQSKAQLALAQQSLTDALKDTQLAATRLNEILDLPILSVTRPNTSNMDAFKLLPDTFFENAGSYQQLLSQLTETALDKRPELTSYSERMASIRSERTMAGTVLLPNVDLKLMTGRVGNTFDNMAGFDQRTLGVSLTLPNMGVSAVTLYREKSIELKQLDHQYQETRNRIQREVTQAYLEALSQRAKLDAVKAELAATEKALEFATERLKVGVGKNIDVTQAQTALSDARMHFVDSLSRYHQAQVHLVTALGLASVKTLSQGLSMNEVSPR